jgi:hypothetical protein
VEEILMLENETIYDTNVGNYEDLYSKDEAFLRFPADWVIRFHNMYMKKNLQLTESLYSYS